MKRSFSKMKLFVVFLLTTFVFVSGVLLGNVLTNQKIERLSSIEQNLKVDILDLETQFILLDEDPCLIDSAPFSEQLYELGSKLDYMENRLGTSGADEIEPLKNFYFLLEIRHWLFLKQSTEMCQTNKSTILF